MLKERKEGLKERQKGRRREGRLVRPNLHPIFYAHTWSTTPRALLHTHTLLDCYPNNDLNFSKLKRLSLWNNTVHFRRPVNSQHTYTLHPDSCLRFKNTIRPPVNALCPAEARRERNFFHMCEGAMSAILSSIFKSSSHLTLYISLLPTLNKL